MWVATVFATNRDRWLAGAVATDFGDQVLAQARAHQLLFEFPHRLLG